MTDARETQPSAERLTRLEVNLRRQKRFTAALGIALIAVVSLAAANKLAELDASTFRLLDPQGKVRATLGMDAGNNPTLTFLTPEGIAVRAIGQNDDLPGRVTELERILGSLQRVQVLGESVPYTPVVPDTVSDIRLSDVERQSDRVRSEVAEQQRLNTQSQDQLRMDQDLRRREHDRWDLQRRIDRGIRLP